MNQRRTITTCSLILGILMMLALTACSSEKMPYDGLQLEDYLTVGDYKGLEVDGYKIKVSEQEIQERVEQALKEKQENKTLDKKTKLQKGDTANIDYVGKVDGKEFDGGASQGFDLELGSGTFIEGFEDGLIGHKVGETVEVKVHFPEDYQGEKVAGKDAVFTVTINSATTPIIPEYDAEFVKANTDFDTKEAYEESLRQEIYDEKEEQAKTEQKNSLWSDVLEKTEVTQYPEEELAAYQEVFDAQIDTMATQYGMTRSDILKQMYGTDEDAKVKSIIEDSTKTLIKQELLTEYIAAQEKLSYTKDEKQAKIDELTGQGYTEETVQQYTGRTMEQYAHITLLYDKVREFLLDNAKVKE